MGTFYNKTSIFSGEITKKSYLFFWCYNNWVIFLIKDGGEIVKELEKLLNLNNYRIIKQEERKEDNKVKKIIYLESKNKKEKCPKCDEYQVVFMIN